LHTGRTTILRFVKWLLVGIASLAALAKHPLREISSTGFADLVLRLVVRLTLGFFQAQTTVEGNLFFIITGRRDFAQIG
jgi:hypothetical protein